MVTKRNGSQPRRTRTFKTLIMAIGDALGRVPFTSAATISICKYAT